MIGFASSIRREYDWRIKRGESLANLRAIRPADRRARAPPEMATFEVFGTTAVLLVTDPAALDDARAIADAELAAVDQACSRFRPDSELSRLNAMPGATHPDQRAVRRADRRGAAGGRA